MPGMPTTARPAARTRGPAAGFSYIPSKLEICFSERCNMACGYCFVDKSSPHTLSAGALRRGLDVFFSLPSAERSVTFNTSEYLKYPALARRALAAAFSGGRSGAGLKVVLTTNGLRLDAPMRRFLGSLGPGFQLNLSWDGAPASHDSSRKLKGGRRGSSGRASANFMALADKAAPRVIVTVTPGEAGRLAENMAFLLSRGFRKFDVFPQMLADWGRRELALLGAGVRGLVLLANGARGVELRLLDRLWGRPGHDGVLLGSDGRFYMDEMVLLLKHRERSFFEIGDARRGLDLERRRLLFEALHREARRLGGAACRSCGPGCGLPLPLFLWCKYRGHDFKSRLRGFCAISRLFRDAAGRLRPEARSPGDGAKPHA